MTIKLSAAALLILPLMLVQTCRAEDEEPPPDYEANTLTGDWGGARTRAWEQGVALDGVFKVDALRRKGQTRSVRHLDLRLRTDLDRLLGWDDTVAYFNVIDDRGHGPNVPVGSLLGVSNIEVPVSTTRIFHAWIQKEFADKSFSLLAGIYPIDSEFFAMESAADLLQPPYGTSVDLALTSAPSVFNNAAFGVRGKWNNEDRTIYMMGAVLDGIPNDPRHPKRTTVRLSGSDGAFGIVEWGWKPQVQQHLFASDAAPSAEGDKEEKYSGYAKLALGLWGYSQRRDDLIALDASGDPLKQRSRGAYVLAERTLFGLSEEGDRHVSAFARYTLADPDTVAVDRTLNLGLKWQGPLAARPQDAISVGWTRGGLSDKYRRQLDRAVSAEKAFEVTWRIALKPWLFIQPDYQEIHHPGGEKGAKKARLGGARFEVAF